MGLQRGERGEWVNSVVERTKQQRVMSHAIERDVRKSGSRTVRRAGRGRFPVKHTLERQLIIELQGALRSDLPERPHTQLHRQGLQLTSGSRRGG